MISKTLPVFKNPEKILSKLIINKENNCWEWQGSLDKDGYGYFKIRNKQERKRYRSHRVLYDFFKGITNNSMVIDHECKNRKCCNPDHLREISTYENLMSNSNGIGSVNSKKTHCKNGHEFTDLNTYVWKKERHCKTCKAINRK
jgi:hypothetical protein